MITGRSSPAGNVRRERAERRGRYAEYAAALFLMSKGYFILARRMKTPAGEIDLIAKRGKRIIFVEVKQRASISECEAAVTGETSRRVHNAAELWLARRAHYHTCEQGFDLVFIVPHRWPVHLPNAL